MINALVLSAAVFIIDGEVDVKGLAKAKPAKRALVQFMKEGPPQLEPFLKEIGFNPLRDLDRLSFRMTQPVDKNEPGDPLIVMDGRFHPKRIHSSWAKNKNKTRIVARKIAGKTSYEGRPNSPIFAVDSKNRIVAGHKSMVTKALNGKLEKLRKIPPFLRDAKLWFRFRSTAEARRHILKTQEASPMAEIHEIQARAGLAGDKVKAKFRIRTRSPDAASGIKLMISMGLMNSNHPSSMRLGRALSYRIQGSTLSIDFSMPLQQIMALRAPPPPPPGRGGPKVIKVKPKAGTGAPGRGMQRGATPPRRP